jgi:ferric enterobactin receptor
MVYTGFEATNLYLVYTEKIPSDNSNLKPSISEQVELGFRYNGKTISSSLFLSAKINRNGFNSYSQFQPLVLPEYGYTSNPGAKPTYFPTGRTLIYAGVKSYVVTNGLRSNSFDAEWMLSTQRLPGISTSFSTSTAVSYSKYFNSNDQRVYQMDTSKIPAGGKALYGIYGRNEYMAWSVRSRVGSDTHIPALGFIISLNADIAWLREQKTLGRNRYQPVGYIDNKFVSHEISNFDPTNPDYGYLPTDPDMRQVNENGEMVYTVDEALNKQPIIYAIISLRLTKEIKKKIRLTVNAYNVANYRPSYYNPQTRNTEYFGSPLSITAGVSIKF